VFGGAWEEKNGWEIDEGSEVEKVGILPNLGTANLELGVALDLQNCSNPWLFKKPQQSIYIS
jgi:hypothetical protein